MNNSEIELQALITRRDAMNAYNLSSNGWRYTEEAFNDLADEMRALKDQCATVTLPKNLEDLPKGEPLPSAEPDDSEAEHIADLKEENEKLRKELSKLRAKLYEVIEVANYAMDFGNRQRRNRRMH